MNLIEMKGDTKYIEEILKNAKEKIKEKQMMNELLIPKKKGDNND